MFLQRKSWIGENPTEDKIQSFANTIASIRDLITSATVIGTLGATGKCFPWEGRLELLAHHCVYCYGLLKSAQVFNFKQKYQAVFVDFFSDKIHENKKVQTIYRGKLSVVETYT